MLFIWIGIDDHLQRFIGTSKCARIRPRVQFLTIRPVSHNSVIILDFELAAKKCPRNLNTRWTLGCKLFRNVLRPTEHITDEVIVQSLLKLLIALHDWRMLLFSSTHSLGNSPVSLAGIHQLFLV